MAFSLEYDSGKVDSVRMYGVQANIMHGTEILYLSPDRNQVLTQGKGHHVDIVMIPARTQIAPKDPKIVVTEQFQQLEQQLGAMTRLTGDRVIGEKAIGWDGFLKEGQVRMVRENIDNGPKGRVSVRYAYKNEQPWIVVQMVEGGGPKTLTMLSWDDQGKLAYKSKSIGDKELTPSDDEAEQLAQQAKDALASVQQSRKDKR